MFQIVKHETEIFRIMNMFKGDRNEMFWHGVMYPCWLGQTKKVNLRIPTTI